MASAWRSPGVEAAILTTPTQMHAKQGVQCMKAGKHVMIEIPIADNLADSEWLVQTQKETGLVAMGGHTRRFNPSHQWIHNRIKKGELKLQHLVVQTFFFRRTNMNALGKPRSWTDHLLWHHACHTVDLFDYQTGQPASHAHAMEGPHHPDLNIAMDMSIQLKNKAGQLCTLALSFNNEGPLGTFFRYICDNGTYIARYDDLVDGKEQPDRSIRRGGVDERHRIAGPRILLRHRREARTQRSVAQVLPAMQTLDALETLAERLRLMRARKIGPFDVPAIGLGCMSLSHAYGTPPAPEDAARLLNHALDMGCTFLDTAALYGFGANETLIGNTLKARRHEYVLASKCGISKNAEGKREINGRPEELLKTLDESLSRLQTDVIDLYYLHRWDKRVPIEESVGALKRMVEAGKVKAIGLSEVSAATLRKAHAVHPIAAVQSEYSLWTRNPEIAVLDACKELGTAFVAFGAVGRAFLAGALARSIAIQPNATSAAPCRASRARRSPPI